MARQNGSLQAKGAFYPNYLFIPYAEHIWKARLDSGKGGVNLVEEIASLRYADDTILMSMQQ